ncbi:hypothetical protein AAG570_012014 [Ranatra chinensis]|uniref:Uncharacterized protein n=1 Tax=Ranatra chinensis TaxID=642074 RepID=A0ABD0YHL0_9HEMI
MCDPAPARQLGKATPIDNDKSPLTPNHNLALSLGLEVYRINPSLESMKTENEVEKPVKREVSFMDPEEPPKPPPRRNRKRRLSKSRRGVTFGTLPESPDTDQKSASEDDLDDPNQLSPEGSRSADSLSDNEMPKSRLPELLRRDTFCDALDFRLYSLRRLPGRRSSSLDALYWQDDECPPNDDTQETVTRSAEHIAPSISERKAHWLRDILEAGGEESEAKIEEGQEPQKNEQNNNRAPALVLDPAELVTTLERIKTTHISSTREECHLVYSSSGKVEAGLKPPQQTSRKSSMSESLQEFESSIIDMLSKDPGSGDEEEKPAGVKEVPPAGHKIPG